MKIFLSFLSLYLVIVALATTTVVHRYHTSVTRVEYNSEERVVEITVQTFADDLEGAISKRTGSNMRLDGSKSANGLLFDYLRSVFQLKSGEVNGELEWIGIEMKGHTAWIYLQAKVPEGLSKASIRNVLLFDLFEDQVNIVNVRNSGKRVSLVFKRGDIAQELP